MCTSSLLHLVVRTITKSVLISLLASSQLVKAWKTFVVPHIDGDDDTPTLMAAVGNFSVNSTIVFEKGKTYNIFTPISFPTLTNVEILIQGNLSYPSDIPTVQGVS